MYTVDSWSFSWGYKVNDIELGAAEPYIYIVHVSRQIHMYNSQTKSDHNCHMSAQNSVLGWQNDRSKNEL